MSVRFVLAPAGAGKTHHCLSSIAAELERDPLGTPLLFILPEQATFIHERMLALLAPGGGFSRAEVASFDRLLRRLPQAEPLPLLSEAGKALLAATAMNKERQHLSVFGSQLGQSGFAAYVAAAAEELLVYGVEPEQLSQAAADLGDTRLMEIALLYAAYRRELDGRFASHAGELRRLAEAIENGLLADTYVYIDGYSEFTPAERQVLGALMKHSAGLEIMLALDPSQAEQARREDAVFYPLWHEYAALSELARQVGAEVLPPLLLDGGQGRFRHHPELAATEALLAGREVQPMPAPPESIRLIRAADRRAELEWTGREILRLVREEGLRYGEISVLTRDSAPYQYLLPTVFGELDIPYFVDSKKPLLYHPLIELIRAALEVWAYKPHYRNIFRFLKNLLVPIAGAEADILDNYCLAHGVRFWDWSRDSWDFSPFPEEDEGLPALVEELRRRGAGPLIAFCESLGQEAGAARLKQALLTMLDELGVWERLRALEDEALQEGLSEQAEQHRQAGDKLLRLLDEAELLLGDTAYPAAQLFQLFEAALSGLTHSTIPPGRDQVFVASLERSRNPEIKAAFVLSLNEGLLPRKISGDGLFSDTDRRDLAGRGLKLAPDLAELQFRENYLAYVALTRSSERLYLSYILADDEGTALSPSPLLRRLRWLFPALPVEEAGCFGPEHLSGCLADLNMAARRLSADSRDALGLALRSHYARDGRYATAIAQLERGLDFRPASSPLSRQTLQRLYGKTLRSSVSRLERYRRCPFAYFSDHGLKLSARREFKLQPADRGQLFHDVLSELGESLKLRGLDWTELDQDLAQELVDASLDAHLPRFLSGMLLSSARYAYIRGRIRDTLTATALLLAESLRRGDFRPVALELPFGGEAAGSLPSFRIPLDNGKTLELYGRIDRVDMARSADGQRAFFRVVDYKTGDVSLDAADIEAGLKLQLLIYLQVTLANHDFFAPGAEALPAGAYYAPVHDEIKGVSGPLASGQNQKIKMSGLTVLDRESVLLQDRDISGRSAVIPVGMNDAGFHNSSPGISREELAELNQHLAEAIRQSAEQLLAGEVAVSPLREKNNDACQYCGYQCICGFDRELGQPRRRQSMSRKGVSRS